jgi:hypothetical protein
VRISLPRDGFATPGDAEPPVGDGQLEMLALVVPGDDLADLLADLGGTERCLGAALHVLLDARQGRRGGR